MSKPEDNKSERIVRHEWLLEGLDCANCANKIEHGVGKVKGMTSSSVNFVTKTLNIEVGSIHEDQTLADARKKIKALEPHIVVIDKRASGSGNERTAQQAHRQVHSHVQHQHDHQHNQADHNPNHNHQHNETSHDHHGHGEASHDHHSHSDDHNHSHSHTHGWNTQLLYRLIAGAVLLLFAFAAPMSPLLELMVYIVAYLIVGGDIVWRAIRNIARRQWFDEYFLMTIAL
jgi:Cd2+/Zn2+-exporting ATPase